MTTATQTRPVTFIAFANNYRLTMEPDRPQYTTDGAGNLRPQGIKKGFSAVFENRRFTTDDPEVIKWLRNHEQFGVARGIREDYDTGRPTVAEQMDAIATFAAEGRIDELRGLIAVEESAGDHGRGNVLGPARKAVERLEAQPAIVDETSEDASEGADADEPSAEADDNVENNADGPDPANSD